MRSDLSAALRRLFPQRGPGRRARGEGRPYGLREVAPEFTTEELEDFLRGDHLPGEADPEFKERLREELWELVQDLYAGSRHDRSTRD